MALLAQIISSPEYSLSFRLRLEAYVEALGSDIEKRLSLLVVDIIPGVATSNLISAGV